MATKVVCCEFADVPMGGIFRHEMCECIDSDSPYQLLKKFGRNLACRCDRNGNSHPNGCSEYFDPTEPVELLDHPADTEFVKHLVSVTTKLDRIREAAESIIEGESRVASEIDIMIVRHIDRLLDLALAYAEAK